MSHDPLALAFRSFGSALGYAVRAGIRSVQAIETSDLALAEKACDDARLAETLSPRSSFAIQQSLGVFLKSAVRSLIESAELRRFGAASSMLCPLGENRAQAGAPP